MKEKATFLKYKLFMYTYWKTELRRIRHVHLSNSDIRRIEGRIDYFTDIIADISQQMKILGNREGNKQTYYVRGLQTAFIGYYKKKLWREQQKIDKYTRYTSNLADCANDVSHAEFHRLYTNHYRFLNAVKESIKIQYKHRKCNEAIFEMAYHPDNVRRLCAQGYSLGEIDIILYDMVDTMI